ncbi:MFS transporter [Archangium violaceum]|uniref:MFS transporter n=1 Tax=Archangium violaceum TaxID=83451 RepID=UPI0019508DFA|nr:MFS transporter [Archangium violaceum]QRO01826.1 MFS transporter [Archangium violaceum]
MDSTSKTPAPVSPSLANFGLLWLGQLVSLLGSGLTSFSLGVWTYERTGSVTEFALITLCSVAPVVVLSPVAGVLVDRWDRRWVMFGSDTAAALSTLTMLLLYSTGRLEVWHVYLGVSVSAAASIFQESAFTAATTMLLPPQHLGRASGLVQLAQAAGRTLSPPLAGMLFVHWGLKGAMLLDLASFVFAISAELLARIPAPTRSAEGERIRDQGLVANLTFGWHYITSRPGLMALLGFFSIVNLTMGLAEVLVTPLVLRMDTPQKLGWVLGCCTLGMVIGSLVMSAWGGPRRRVLGVLGAGVLYGLCVMLTGLRPSLLLITLAGFGLMFFNPPMGACSQALWQTKVPADVQGRVFAVRTALAWASTPIAYLVGGPLADRVFEPMLMPGGALASSVGRVLGVGPGRGIGFFMMLMGLLAILAAIGAYLYRPVRELDDEPSSSEPAPAGSVASPG